jgi:hypothetical protein
MLDYWIGKLRRLAADAPNLQCNAKDIVYAMQGLQNSSGMLPGGKIPIYNDPQKGSNMTLFAVKAPHGSVVQVPNRPKARPGVQRPVRRLYISSDPNLALSLENQEVPKKRGRPKKEDNENPAKRAKKNDRQLHIYLLPTKVGADGKVKSAGVKPLPDNLGAYEKHSLGTMFSSTDDEGFIYDFTPALTREEGVSDFFPAYEPTRGENKE